MGQEAFDYLAAEKALTLATCGSDGPWAATFTYVNEDSILYMWSRTGTTTAEHVEENSTVAFTIDEYSEDWRQTKGIQGRGECTRITDGEEMARVADLFGQKYPDLRPGSTSSIVFLRLEPSTLEFIDNSRAADGADSDFGADYRRESVFT